jgi:hypothetical protein
VSRWDRVLRAADRWQQRHRWLAFGVAAWKKFADDQAGNLAALVAYYAFASIFPLLLVLVTVLDLVLSHNPAARERVINSALAGFPVIGNQLKQNVHAPEHEAERAVQRRAPRELVRDQVAAGQLQHLPGRGGDERAEPQVARGHLLAWLFLEAQITLYAVEINVTAVRKLWPRSLFPPPLTDQDLAAYRLYAQTERRSPEVKIDVQETDRPEPDPPGR